MSCIAAVPKDFDTIELPFRERGEPRLVKGGALGSDDARTPVAAVPPSEEAP